MAFVDIMTTLVAGLSSLGMPGVPWQAHPDFGRSVNPISTRGGQIMPIQRFTRKG